MTPQVYKFLKDKVQFICEKLKLSKFSKSTGRKLSISIPDTVTLAPYKQTQGIQTKKSIWEDFKKILKCCYETPVVNMNRWSISALLILKIILGGNGRNSHLIKHSDSADIPVCLNKNAKHHKTMKSPSSLGHSGKGMFFYGLKLHLISDLNRKILSVSFASANVGDREMFMKPNKDLEGIFVADAGYASEKLEREFFIENKRILLAKPRKNMRKVITFSRRNFTTPE